MSPMTLGSKAPKDSELRGPINGTLCCDRARGAVDPGVNSGKSRDLLICSDRVLPYSSLIIILSGSVKEL